MLSVGYDLEYSAVAQCPTSQEFQAIVERQLAEYGDGLPNPARAHVLVRLAKDGSEYAASFGLTRSDGSSSKRELHATTCEDAASALAFVLALSLGGRDRAAKAAAEAPNPAEARPGKLDAEQPVPPALPPQDLTQSAAPPLPAVAQSTPHREAPAAWRYGLGVQIGMRSGLGPTATGVEAAFFELQRHLPRWPWQTRAELQRGTPTTATSNVGQANLSWLALEVETCPLEFSAGAFSALPCAGLHLGRLSASGVPKPGPGSKNRDSANVWLDVALGGRVELRLMKNLALSLQGELVAPITRYKIAFDRPDAPVYSIPTVAGAAFVGLVTRFP